MEYYLNLKHLSDTISVCDTQESASLRIQEIRLPTLLEGTDSHEFGNMSHSKMQLEALGSRVTYLHVTRRVKTRINQPARSRSSGSDLTTTPQPWQWHSASHRRRSTIPTWTRTRKTSSFLPQLKGLLTCRKQWSKWRKRCASRKRDK